MVLGTFERLPDPLGFHVTHSKITHHERTLPPRRNEIRVTRAKGAKGSKVFQIPLFPPLAKGDEGGFLVFFAFLASWRLGAIKRIISAVRFAQRRAPRARY